MKKIMVILFSLIIFISARNVFADVIMEGYKPVQFCAKITNLDQYPMIDVLADQYGATANHDIFVVENNKCIQTYKFNNIDLYWNTKGNTNLDPSKKLAERFQHYHEPVMDANPLQSITREYILSQNSDGTFSLVLAREEILPEILTTDTSRKIQGRPHQNNGMYEKTTEETVKKPEKKESQPVVQKEHQEDAQVQVHKSAEQQKDNAMMQEKIHHEDGGFFIHQTLWEKIISFFAHIFS